MSKTIIIKNAQLEYVYLVKPDEYKNSKSYRVTVLFDPNENSDAVKLVDEYMKFAKEAAESKYKKKGTFIPLETWKTKETGMYEISAKVNAVDSNGDVIPVQRKVVLVDKKLKPLAASEFDKGDIVNIEIELRPYAIPGGVVTYGLSRKLKGLQFVKKGFLTSFGVIEDDEDEIDVPDLSGDVPSFDPDEGDF